jgi:hypothetical protein
MALLSPKRILAQRKAAAGFLLEIEGELDYVAPCEWLADEGKDYFGYGRCRGRRSDDDDGKAYGAWRYHLAAADDPADFITIVAKSGLAAMGGRLNLIAAGDEVVPGIRAINGAVQERSLTFASHFPKPKLGHLSVEGCAWSWNPVTWEFSTQI